MERPTRTQTIKSFLEANTHPDLASLYNHDMETQANVAQEGGRRIEGDFKGRQWHAWTDGIQIWKSFRIPYKAKTEPEYTDVPMSYDFARYIEGIGMTGWDWMARMSRWVAYDFDAITGHSEKHNRKLSEAELDDVARRMGAIPWCTLRRSTSGKGLHLYVFLNPYPTANHTEHAALARAILGQLSALTRFDFATKVDICGGNMWVWHRKMKGTDGLQLLKAGERLESVPVNWRDHLEVVSTRRRKTLPTFIVDQKADGRSEIDVWFDELAGKQSRIPLDEQHSKLIEWLRVNNCCASWDQDHWMLITHTFHLKEAHEQLQLRGKFDTQAAGSEAPNDHNCGSYEMEVLTRSGVFQIGELAKKGHAELYVLTGNGMQWIDCEIRQFGEQEVYPVYFSNGTCVKATRNHRWLFSNHGKISESYKTTCELTSSSRLPFAKQELPEIDWEGFAHGFTFGDGTCFETEKHERRCRVVLFKKDDELSPILVRFGNLGSKFVEGHGYLNTINSLPGHWKEFPDDSVSKSYALGFILGLITADGKVTHERVELAQSGQWKIDKIRWFAQYAGLHCHPVKQISWEGQVNGHAIQRTNGFAFTISRYNLEKHHFVRSDHKTNFCKDRPRDSVRVNYIGAKEEKQPVFCAVVPGYENFTLGNGVITKNCFCFPMRKGAWAVRRYTPGVAEASLWEQDGAGWTRCFYNKEPDIKAASKAFEGMEHPMGGYSFKQAELAKKAAELLGANIELPAWIMSRKALLKEHKDGRLVFEIDLDQQNDVGQGGMEGWITERNKYKRVFDVKARDVNELDVSAFDDLVRHVVSPMGDDCGWLIKSEGIWKTEPLTHVKHALTSMSFNAKEVNLIIGTNVMKCWTLVNQPFKDEYPSGREWNRNAPQLRFRPSENVESLTFPTWLRMLKHIGSGLDKAVEENQWCASNGILTGADYLKCWIASLFQYPLEPLPYLFLFGDQNCGKSVLHEAILLLVTHGVVRADQALVSQFNGELANAIVAVVEETDLRRNKPAYNKIKDWVTARQLSIRALYQEPYLIPNATHWIQCSNDYLACPIFPGDTRVVYCNVPNLKPEELIPKRLIMTLLEKEAPEFLAELLNLEIPQSPDRLNIPVITTQEKMIAEDANKTHLEQFIGDMVHHVTGKMIKFSEFYEKFIDWLDPMERAMWTKNRMGRELPPKFPKGRSTKHLGQHFIGNVSWTAREADEQILPRIIRRGEMLDVEVLKNEVPDSSSSGNSAPTIHRPSTSWSSP